MHYWRMRSCALDGGVSLPRAVSGRASRARARPKSSAEVRARRFHHADDVVFQRFIHVHIGHGRP